VVTKLASSRESQEEALTLRRMKRVVGEQYLEVAIDHDRCGLGDGETEGVVVFVPFRHRAILLVTVTRFAGRSKVASEVTSFVARATDARIGGRADAARSNPVWCEQVAENGRRNNQTSGRRDVRGRALACCRNAGELGRGRHRGA
jgi:hypothetical protein